MYILVSLLCMVDGSEGDGCEGRRGILPGKFDCSKSDPETTTLNTDTHISEDSVLRRCAAQKSTGVFFLCSPSMDGVPQ